MYIVQCTHTPLSSMVSDNLSYNEVTLLCFFFAKCTYNRDLIFL